MTPDRTTLEKLDDLEEQTMPELDSELGEAWRAAEAHAEAAYQAWRRAPGPDAYAVYRAAEEQAHSAAESLRAWSQSRRRWLGSRAAATIPA